MIGRATALAAALLVVAGPTSADSPRDHAAWWVESFGVLDAAADGRVERAESVFARVAAVADKDSRRQPRLLIVRPAGGPFALALPDGTVVLTQEGLALCYQEPSAGDARLAFVLGHELAHLGRDDFWHSFAAADVRAAAERSLAHLVRQSPEEARAKELQADSYGAIYMWLAGYSPDAVFGESTSFLEAWVSRTAAETEPSPHPPPRTRAALVRAQLQSVAEQLDFFHFGVRLYQLGRYQDALVLLERFKDRFPGREVLNDLGLIHYQLALRALASCRADDALRFKLPTSFDPETLARRVRARGDRPSCTDDPVFRRRAQEALRHFEQATARDEAYLPSRINASSVLLLMGEPARALAEAEEALKRRPADPAALNNKALALYLYGLLASIDTVEPALALLSDLRASAPGDSIPAYNLAAVLTERGRGAAAQGAWEEYLALEDQGPFAQAARARLAGRPLSDAPGPRVAGAGGLPPAPVPLGAMSVATARQLRGLRKKAFDTGVFAGAIYRDKQVGILEIDGSIEVVETAAAQVRSVEEVTSALGRALREETTGTVRTLVYRGFACDVVDGQVVRRVFFTP